MKKDILILSFISIWFGLVSSESQETVVRPKEENSIHGKYLHLTDIHMDKHYIKDATIGSNCHREPEKHKKRKKKEGLLSGYWGAPATECDSPPKLVYSTINTIANEWKDKIDFIIWTGDNARHDGDGLIKRTKKEIIGYNKKTIDLLKKAFTLNETYTLPIVPVLGNNDIHPHNELRGMKDNPQLIEFSELWKDFIPQDQIREFQKGGYYRIDVAPGIRILALNTLYFFASNDVVTACSDPKSPGARHIRWLKKQLKKARKDNYKVIIIGHVPPTVKTFKDSCLDDYISLSVKNSDIITGHMYGHSNMDHFQIISKQFLGTSLESNYENSNNDITDSEYHQNSNCSTKKKQKVKTIHEKARYEKEGDPLSILKDKNRFISSLRDQYNHIKNAYDRNSLVVVHVAPPMLPLFYPTFRINEYQANPESTDFGMWLKYTQWYSNLTYWNEQRDRVTRKHLDPQFEIEYETDVTYRMTNLSSESWLEFAETIAKKRKGKQLWDKYLDHMFVKTDNSWYGQSIPVQPPSKSWQDILFEKIINWFFFFFFA